MREYLEAQRQRRREYYQDHKAERLAYHKERNKLIARLTKGEIDFPEYKKLLKGIAKKQK
jgi:hypothetical protein